MREGSGTKSRRSSPRTDGLGTHPFCMPGRRVDRRTISVRHHAVRARYSDFAICSCGGISQICQWYRVCDAGALRAEPLATLLSCAVKTLVSPAPPPPRGETRARPPPTSGVDGRRVEPRLERPRGQGAAPEAPLQELGRLAPPPGPPPPPPPPPPPLERPLGRGAAPEVPHQAVRPPVPPSFPPPTLPFPPPPLERLQGRGAAPAAPHQAFGPRGPPPYPPPLPPPPPPPPAGPPPYGPARNNLGGPGPPRRKLVYPGGGGGGGELPRYDSGPADEPESRGRRAPGGAWGQLSEEARDELTRPLRVESGRTSSPGEGPSQWQPDHRDLRQGGPRLPEPGEEPAEGGGASRER